MVGHGKITVAGSVGSSFVALARYRGNGQVDRSFGRKGVVRTHLGTRLTAEDLALQKDGRLIVTGTSGIAPAFTVLRYQSTGDLDPNFGDGGVFRPFATESAAYAAAIQRDGRIVAGGQSGLGSTQQFALARFLPGD